MSVDSDWGTEIETRKPISGQVALFGMTLISWKSKKQQTIALSSAETEYMAVSDFAKEIRSLLANLGFTQDGPTRGHHGMH